MIYTNPSSAGSDNLSASLEELAAANKQRSETLGEIGPVGKKPIPFMKSNLDKSNEAYAEYREKRDQVQDQVREALDNGTLTETQLRALSRDSFSKVFPVRTPDDARLYAKFFQEEFQPLIDDLENQDSPTDSLDGLEDGEAGVVDVPGESSLEAVYETFEMVETAKASLFVFLKVLNEWGQESTGANSSHDSFFKKAVDTIAEKMDTKELLDLARSLEGTDAELSTEQKAALGIALAKGRLTGENKEFESQEGTLGRKIEELERALDVDEILGLMRELEGSGEELSIEQKVRLGMALVRGRLENASGEELNDVLAVFGLSPDMLKNPKASIDQLIVLLGTQYPHWMDQLVSLLKSSSKDPLGDVIGGCWGEKGTNVLGEIFQQFPGIFAPVSVIPAIGDVVADVPEVTAEKLEAAREVARVFFKDLMQELKDDPVMKDMVEKAGGPDVSYEEALDIFLEISLTSNFDQQILGIALMLKSSDVVADLDPKALQVGIDDILLRLKDGKGIGLIPTGDGRNVSLSKESMRRILTKYPPLALSLSVILKKNPKIDLAAAMKILVESTRAEAGETLPVSSEKPVSTADKPESPAAAVVRPRISPERKEQLRLRREAAKKIALGIPALLLPIRADLEAAFNAKAASKGKPKTDINWNEIFNSVNIELQKNLNPSETAHLPDSNDLGDLIRDTFLAEQGGGVKAFFEMIGETLTGKKKVDFLEQEIYKSLHTSTFEQLYESNHSVLIVTYGPRDGEGPKIYARIQDKKTEKRVTVPSAKKMATIKDPQRIEEIKNEINRREGLYETMNLKDPVTIHDKYKTFVESGGQLEYGEWKGEAESSFSMEEKILSRFGPLINMLKIMMAFMSGKPEQLEAILKNEGTKPEFVENNTEQVAIWQEHGEKIDTERKNIAAWEDLLDDDPKKVLLGKVQAYVDVSEKTVHPNEVEEALVEKGKELIPVLKTKDLKINLTGKISLDGFKSLLKAEVSVSDNKEVLINGHVLAEWTDDALDLILDKDADYDPESEGDPADAIDAAGLSPKQVQAKLSVIGELLVGVKLPGMDGIMVGDKEYSIAAAGKVYQSASTSGSSSWSEVDEEALTKQVVESLEPFASDSNIIRMTSFFQKLGDGGASLSKNGEYIPLNLLQAVSGLSPTAYRTLSFDSAWFGGNAKVNFNDETERVNSYSDITRLLGVSEGRV